MARGTDLIGVVEAAYELEKPTSEWLSGLSSAIAPWFDRGRGIVSAEYDARDAEHMRLHNLTGMNLSPVRSRLVGAGVVSAGEDIIERLRWESCGTLSEKLGGAPTLRRFPLLTAASALFGTKDILGLNAGDSTLRGICFAAPMNEVAKTDVRFRMTWTRVAAHMAAGFRLRREIQALELMEGAEAILEPNGKIAHVEGLAEEQTARVALRSAALALDRARTRKARSEDPDGAVREWQALVHGRWSLVDHFERDGRRYLVARRNDPQAEDTGKLSLRERQVIGFAALGHSNRLIGYELGIAASTVGTHLKTAMDRLQIDSRLELIRQFKAGRL
ncbi:MAG: helix-turn-helix transcriptional regulator [Archangium sp.]|nr:helix-turn-helix transcriptional regulator [Archangium sp.]